MKCEAEIWIAMDEAGSLICAADQETASELAEEAFGDEDVRWVKLLIKMSPPSLRSEFAAYEAEFD